MLLRLFIILPAFISTALLAENLTQRYLPENNLHTDAPFFGGESSVSQEQFFSIINKTEVFFAPLIAQHNAFLTVQKFWDNPTVNAYATKYFVNGVTIWNVAMYGGLARRPEITPDGFQLIVCHELGHHLAGYSFYNRPDNMADEGQSDYFSTHACLRAVWKDSMSENKSALAQARSDIAALCKLSWKTPVDQAICARSVEAGKSAASLMASLERSPAPQIDTPSPDVVSVTNHRHPAAQCRLDIYIAGSVCAKQFDLNFIPGINYYGQSSNSLDSEIQSNKFVCNKYDGDLVGTRPRCWFASLIQ